MAENQVTLDRICGAALSMGFSKTDTALIEFTGTTMREHRKSLAPLSPTSASLPTIPLSELKPAVFEPSREAIDSRLELLQRNEYVLPVEGRYWSSLGDYFAGKEPHYKGEIGKDKAAELGLYDAKAQLVRVYADSVTYPRFQHRE